MGQHPILQETIQYLFLISPGFWYLVLSVTPPQEVGINSRTSVNVTLAEELQALSEVVVTALGIKREARTLGYATAI